MKILRTEEMFDLPFDGEFNVDKEGIPIKRRITHWFSWLAFFVLGFVAKVAFRYKVINKRIVTDFKDKRGCIIIANHESYLDAVFAFLGPRPKCCPRIVARETLFEGKPWIARQIIARAGAFPISRETSDRKSLKRAVKMLQRKEMVTIMPEGTRRGRGTADLSLHSGFAFIAKMAGDAPIIPCAFRNVGKIKKKGERLHFPKVEIEYGEPILLSDFDCFEKKDRLAICSWWAMREVFALRDAIKPEQVDMKALFPNDIDYSDVEEVKNLHIHHTTEELLGGC